MIPEYELIKACVSLGIHTGAIPVRCILAAREREYEDLGNGNTLSINIQYGYNDMRTAQHASRDLYECVLEQTGTPCGCYACHPSGNGRRVKHATQR